MYTQQIKLFATLDPTLRKIDIKDVGPAILADTVGFIRHLPHDLVAAFKATLQETQEADLLIHVVDFADDQNIDNMKQVNDVLAEIDADEIPQLIVCNKIDRMESVEPHIDTDDEGKPLRVWISAQEGLGIDLLQTALTQCLMQSMMTQTLQVPPADGKLRAVFHEYDCITEQSYDEQGQWIVTVRLPSSDWYQLDKRLDGALSLYSTTLPKPQHEDDW